MYCPQCNTQYLIDYPALGTFLKLIEQVDGFFNRISPLATAGLLVGSLYWSAVTYGAVTVFQVLGQRTGLRIMEESDPLVLLIGLPTIPLTLILAKMIRWHDYVLRAWRHLTPGMVFFKYLFPNESTEHQVPMRVPTEDTVVDATSATRIICGALALPSIAMFCGNILFNHSPSGTKRIFLVRPVSLIIHLKYTLLSKSKISKNVSLMHEIYTSIFFQGGLVYVLTKGCLKMYYKQQQYLRLAKRKIRDYPADYF